MIGGKKKLTVKCFLLHHVGIQSYQLVPPGAPFPFYDKSSSPGEFLDRQDDLGEMSEEAVRDKSLEEYLESNWTATAIKGILHQLNISLPHEPAYSGKIFNHLLAKSVHTRAVDETLFLFLDDLTLNIRGAGNFAAAVEHLAAHQTRSSKRRNCLRAVFRALELGLIPPDELLVIVKTIPEIRSGSGVDKMPDSKYVTDCYRLMWDALGRCEVFGHSDLNPETVDVWLGILEQQDSPEVIGLAKDIILGTQSPDSSGFSWVLKFITRWLELGVETKSANSNNLVIELLDHFDSDTASRYIIHVTEALASSSRDGHRTLLLERWQDCLSELQDARSLVRSPSWLDMDPQKTVGPSNTGLKGPTRLSEDRRIVLRLWVLRTLSRNLPEGPLWRRHPRQTDLPILHLFDHYESLTKEIAGEDFLGSLMKGIHDLDIPFNGLLMLAVNLRIRRGMTPATRKALQHLERTRVSLADVFTDLDAYNTTNPLFFPAYEKMIRQIDITSAAFIDHSVHLAKTGDTKNVWTLIRLLRSHTPLKVALAKSWHREEEQLTQPSAEEQQKKEGEEEDTAKPKSNLSPRPDPHAAVEMIHILAIAISCSKKLSPCRSYHLIHWLYDFLMTHHAPVKPALVRAMYHAGIIRYQREGRRVAPTRFLYILELVKEFEDPHVARELLEGPKYGESRNGHIVGD